MLPPWEKRIIVLLGLLPLYDYFYFIVENINII